jgi:pimeloyl-ACP methyl ester carboxylesterase
MVRDVAGVPDEFADAVGLGRFSIAGSSLGGYFAWRHALARPERVECMILVDSAGYPFDMPPMLRLASAPVVGDTFRFFSPRFLVARSVREIYGDRRRIQPGTVRRYHELMLRPGTAARCARPAPSWRGSSPYTTGRYAASAHPRW